MHSKNSLRYLRREFFAAVRFCFALYQNIACIIASFVAPNKKRTYNHLQVRIFTGDPGQIRTADLPLRSFNNIKINVFMCNIPSFYAEFCCIMRKFCKHFRIFSMRSNRISHHFVLFVRYIFLCLQSVYYVIYV